MKMLAGLGIVAMLTLGASAPASAQTAEALGSCLVDSLDGKERKRLARWIFFSMAAHPEINSYLEATPKDIQSNDEYVGQLVTRLLAEDCPNELKAANAQDPRAVEKSFELVGQVAMQELMRNDEVRTAISNYARHADTKKISAVIGAPE